MKRICKKDKSKRKKKEASTLKRLLHIGHERWSWVLNNGVIHIKSPQGKTSRVLQCDFFNVHPDEIERAQWKQYMGQYAVTPSMIKAYIEQNLKA